MLRISGGVEVQHPAAQCVAGLVVGDDLALGLSQASGLLGADGLAKQSLVEILTTHAVALGAAGDDRALVERVGELCSHHARGLAGDVAQVEVGSQRLALGVGPKDRLAPVTVGRRDKHLAVKAARAHQGLIELLHVV